jgi:hypothetical protein
LGEFRAQTRDAVGEAYSAGRRRATARYSVRHQVGVFAVPRSACATPSSVDECSVLRRASKVLKQRRVLERGTLSLVMNE